MKLKRAMIKHSSFHFNFYILLLNTTLSEKIALPATNPTAAIIGRLIVAPAIPVDIPIRIDRPKVNTITMKAYQPGNAPSKTSNKASGSAPYSERKHKATPRQGNIFKRFTALMVYFIRYKFI